MINYTYRVLSQFEGGQPSNLRPSATVAPSLQQPYLVSPHVSKVGQSKSNGPAAALKSSGQQPNVVFEQSTNGAGLHRRSPKMAWSSSLVSSKKSKLKRVKNGGKVPKNSQNGNTQMLCLNNQPMELVCTGVLQIWLGALLW